MGSNGSKGAEKRLNDANVEHRKRIREITEQQRVDQAKANAENQRVREEANAKLVMKQKEAHQAEMKAQNERLEREKIAIKLKEERAAMEAKAETSKLLLEQQKQMIDLQLATQKEKISHAEETTKNIQCEKQRMEEDFRKKERDNQAEMQKFKTNMEKLKEEALAERANLQLKMEKQKGESKNQLTMKEEELRRSRLEMSHLQQQMDSEKSSYDQNILKKKKELRKAKDKTEELLVEKEKMEEDHKRKIQEQFDCRLQEQKEAREEQRDFFFQWRTDEKRHLELHMQRELEFRHEMLKVQSQVLEHQTKQFEMLAIGLQGMAGSGFMGPAIANMKSLGPTPDEKQHLIMRSPCVVIIDNFEKGEPLYDVVKNDEDMLRILFEHFEADVRPILNDQCLRISTRRYGRQDYSANDGIIVFLFSHGNNKTLQDRNENIQIEEVLQIFEDNRSLDGKPKLFCVQVMRRNGEEINESSQLPKKTDFLVCYCEMTEETYIQSADDQAGSAFTDCMRNAVVTEQNCNIKRILEIVQHTLTARLDGVVFEIQSDLNVPVQLMFE